MQKNQGIILILTLIILLSLSVLSVIGMQTMILQETMAGNMRNRSLAFQAADSALRGAEAAIQAVINAGTVAATYAPGSPADATLAVNEAFPNIFDDSQWASRQAYNGNGGQFSALVGSGQLAAVPRFMARYLGQMPIDLSQRPLTAPSANNLPPVSLYDTFEIISRGSGGTAQVRVLLQSMYAGVPAP
jgi:type IV pilus assembly protein PilX